jgi:hypothetical protein
LRMANPYFNNKSVLESYKIWIMQKPEARPPVLVPARLLTSKNGYLASSG